MSAAIPPELEAFAADIRARDKVERATLDFLIANASEHGDALHDAAQRAVEVAPEDKRGLVARVMSDVIERYRRKVTDEAWLRAMCPKASAPAMTAERACEITSACVAHCSWHMMARDGEAQPPLPDCSLEEMLVANRMVGEMPDERVENADGSGGSYALRLRCDPRIIAACYALANYGGSPAALLQAVGYRFTVNEDKRTKRRRKAEKAAARGGAA